MRRFFQPHLDTSRREIVLSESGTHHLLGVLRAQPGECVLVFDGEGLEAECTFQGTRGAGAVLEVVGWTERAKAGVLVHLLLALTKGPAMDAAVRMATEAGATHIHPVVSARSVARGERVDRWVRIAVSAAQQSRRPTVPNILPVASFSDAVASLPNSMDRRIAMPGAPRQSPPGGPAAIVIGPEGGLTPAELEYALSLGFSAVGLGRFTLRVETAAALGVASIAPA
jgi:16S rRNA (uracil1498-N3)-methyltransferase